MHGEQVPYFTAEDLLKVLSMRGIRFSKTRAESELKFPDSAANRRIILRFLLADHYQRFNDKDKMAIFFDAYAEGGMIRMPLIDEVFEMKP